MLGLNGLQSLGINLLVERVKREGMDYKMDFAKVVPEDMLNVNKVFDFLNTIKEKQNKALSFWNEESFLGKGKQFYQNLVERFSPSQAQQPTAEQNQAFDLQM